MVTTLLLWLLDTTLKGSLMILLVAALQRLLGNRVDARFRHLLWVVVLLRLLIPVAPSSSLSFFNLLPARPPALMMQRVPTEAPLMHTGRLGFVETVTIAERGPITVARWIVGVWLLGAIAMMLRMLIASIRMQRDVNQAMRTHPGPIIECDFVRTPGLHGLFRPVLLIPPGLSAEELRHVVLHESWHHKRLDVAVSWLLSVVQAVHWFNPLIWFAASRIKEERELSCDELALSLLEEEERESYGRTILKLLERFRMAAPVPALVGIVNDKQKMKRRIKMIATFQSRRRSTMLFLMLVAAVGAAGLTDAPAGKLFIRKTIDPAAAVTIEKLDQFVTFELTNATIGDLLQTVTDKTGVAVVSSPELSTLAVQQARFTIKAENVSANVVLMEALMPFELTAEPTAAGIAIAEGSNLHRAEAFTITREGSKEHKRIFVKKTAPHASFDSEGQTHRELKFNISRDGVKTEGRLTIDITK